MCMNVGVICFHACVIEQTGTCVQEGPCLHKEVKAAAVEQELILTGQWNTKITL